MIIILYVDRLGNADAVTRGPCLFGFLLARGIGLACPSYTFVRAVILLFALVASWLGW